jgi:enterochelin esterase-like enzyme
VIPYIEKHYRVIPKKDGRAIAGLSMGGGRTWASWRIYLSELAPKLFQ